MSAGPVKAKPAAIATAEKVMKTAKNAPTAKRPVAKPAAKPANPTRITATNADEIMINSFASVDRTLTGAIAEIMRIENDVHALRVALRSALAENNRAAVAAAKK